MRFPCTLEPKGGGQSPQPVEALLETPPGVHTSKHRDVCGRRKDSQGVVTPVTKAEGVSGEDY